MSLEKVLDQIRQDGEQKAAIIRKEGEDEAQRILQNAQAKADEKKMRMEDELAERVAYLMDVRLSKRRMEGKRKHLVDEKRLMGEFRKAFEERVRSFDQEKNRALLKKLLNIARASPAFSIQSIVSKDEDTDISRELPFYLYCNKRDRTLVMELSNLEVADTIDCLGGIIAEAEDHSWRINLTYDVLLEEFYERSVRKIHGLLMGEAEDG